ncbi:hypothetical protein V6N13_064105 [Hibiscus sabdariffa]|uniref:Uncharacterized protein n=1 Tax=Hibiscus sabdariffa TaxID=183260 RepID=A0ABR2R2J2_9ROSI
MSDEGSLVSVTGSMCFGWGCSVVKFVGFGVALMEAVKQHGHGKWELKFDGEGWSLSGTLKMWSGVGEGEGEGWEVLDDGERAAGAVIHQGCEVQWWFLVGLMVMVEFCGARYKDSEEDLSI